MYSEIIFWLSFLTVIYAYFGYPLVLAFIGKTFPSPVSKDDHNFTLPVSVLIPVHNEEKVILNKLNNTAELDYPDELIEILFISDGSTDATNNIISENRKQNYKLIEINDRKGKANALNKGLEYAKNEIIVFSDASILLDKQAIRNIILPFQDDRVGCVSGEDHIQESGGEGAYGRYELWLRNLESQVHSLVGASGSFYAQRKVLCKPFAEGLAPDFLSVLNTVEHGYRAITEPKAYGLMSSVKSTSDEFNRKVRTLIRGMSALFEKKHLLNIFRFGFFSFALISHKLIRWFVPFFLIMLLISNLLLLDEDFYLAIAIMQTGFYMLAMFALKNIVGLGDLLPGKIALYFTMVNLSILVAWKRYWSGVRQEIWNPSNRSS